MSKICVPYKDNNLPNPRYRLYSVTMKKSRLPFWNITPARADDEAIIKKFKGLQNFFVNHYRRKYPADFYLKTISPVDNTHENVKKLDNNTTSVFLGIFIKAAVEINEWKFREEWKIVCATGDLKYDSNSETLNLVSVLDIDNKYKDEFETEASKNKDGKYLFLYINDKEIIPVGEKQGENGNITVKYFSPENTIDDIFDYLFIE